MKGSLAPSWLGWPPCARPPRSPPHIRRKCGRALQVADVGVVVAVARHSSASLLRRTFSWRRRGRRNRPQVVAPPHRVPRRENCRTVSAPTKPRSGHDYNAHRSPVRPGPPPARREPFRVNTERLIPITWDSVTGRPPVGKGPPACGGPGPVSHMPEISRAAASPPPRGERQCQPAPARPPGPPPAALDHLDQALRRQRVGVAVKDGHLVGARSSKAATGDRQLGAVGKGGSRREGRAVNAVVEHRGVAAGVRTRSRRSFVRTTRSSAGRGLARKPGATPGSARPG